MSRNSCASSQGTNASDTADTTDSKTTGNVATLRQQCHTVDRCSVGICVVPEVVRGARLRWLRYWMCHPPRPFIRRWDYGAADVTDQAPNRKHSPAAERMRLSRLRRREGMQVIPFEVRDAEIENLIKLRLLCVAARGDRQAIARALETLLDRIPVSWWQAAMELRGKS